MAPTATRPVTEESTKAASGRERSPRAIAAIVASDAASAMKAAADDAATRIPGIAAMGRSAFDEATRRIDSSSDEKVRLGTVLSFGFTAGLLIGGAPRFLIGAALVPTAMLGMALLDRTTDGQGTGFAAKGAGDQ